MMLTNTNPADDATRTAESKQTDVESSRSKACIGATSKVADSPLKNAEPGVGRKRRASVAEVQSTDAYELGYN